MRARALTRSWKYASVYAFCGVVGGGGATAALFFVRGPVALALPVRPARAFSRLVLGDAARRRAGEQHQAWAQGVRRGREREEADPHGFGVSLRRMQAGAAS